MAAKLSIIIPCFNCEKTLCEAVDSCYIQDLDNAEFEVIMVDDGSTDGTRPLMERLASEHGNIRLVFHEKNRGGGAARNTGIKQADGEIIYCLDSDNVFAPHSVIPMLDYLRETKSDGVAFYERRFFIGNNKKKYSAHINQTTDRSIELFDILNGSGTLLDNFFYTKAAYNKTDGYPEHHGFDTQCFEVRFLSAGNKVWVVPQSIFWHRQAGGKKSYFERVYESGEYSLNMYYILEEILHLLSPEARQLILNYDVFGNSKLGENNLSSYLVEKFKNDMSSLFMSDFKRYVGVHGFDSYHAEKAENDTLIHAIWLLNTGQFEGAARFFLKTLQQYPDSLILQFNLLRCTAGTRGILAQSIDKAALETSQRFVLRRQKIDLDPNVIKRFAIKLKNLLQ